jgi:hypothetical protein
MLYREAVERAKQGIRAGLDSDPLWMMIEESAAARAIRIAASADNIALILDWAEGEADGFDALKRGVCYGLEHGENLHPDVMQWLLKYLRGQIVRPASKAGRKKAEWSEWRIYFEVKRLQDAGITATRNEASEATSACDAVGDALGDLGLSPTSYASISRIWFRINKIKSIQ